MEVEAGKEGMKFEASAFSYYGVTALTASPGECLASEGGAASEGPVALPSLPASSESLPCLPLGLLIAVCHVYRETAQIISTYLCELSQTKPRPHQRQHPPAPHSLSATVPPIIHCRDLWA